MVIPGFSQFARTCTALTPDYPLWIPNFSKLFTQSCWKDFSKCRLLRKENVKTDSKCYEDENICKKEVGKGPVK